MKLSNAAIGILFSSVFGSEITLGASKRALALSEDSYFNVFPTDPFGIDGLAIFGRELDEFSLNEAMRRMGEGVGVCDKAHLLNENKAIMRKSYEELVDYAMGYGLTELLRSLLFRRNGWKNAFERHVYAAHLYKKEGFPLEEWLNQEDLDWSNNYQAIFKADSPVLLRDMAVDSQLFQKQGGSTISSKRPMEEVVMFIRKHLIRLILYYDSARILKALEVDNDLANLLLPDTSIRDIQHAIKHCLDNHLKLYIVGCHRKLRTLLNVSDTLYSWPELTYDDLEFALERGLSVERMLSDIIAYDYDWALEMLHRKSLLGGLISSKCIFEAIRCGSYKVLEWIYDRIHEELPILRDGFSQWLKLFPTKYQHRLIKVHRGLFHDYLPSLLFINGGDESAEMLDYLETFGLSTTLAQHYVCDWFDFGLKLRVYKANPTWIISDDEIKKAVKEGHLEFIEYALSVRKSKEKISNVNSLRLIQYNTEKDKDYVPSKRELRKALIRDDIGLASWLHGQSRFRRLCDECDGLFFGKRNKSLELIKWLLDNKKIEPSIEDLKYLIITGKLEAYEWAWDKFKSKMQQLRGMNITILEKEAIEWWIENVDKEYKLDIFVFLKECARRCDIESARWIIEMWPLNLRQHEVTCITQRSVQWFHEDRTKETDFIELLYVNNKEILSENLWDREGSHWRVRSRPNLKRILAEHAHCPISMDEWEFLASLPELYGVDSEAVKRIIARNDFEVLALLHKYRLSLDLEGTC